MGMTVIIRDDEGREIPRNSQAAYEHIAVLLWKVEGMLQDNEAIVPTILRDDFMKLRGHARDLASDASQVTADLKRWNGDHEKALAERNWRNNAR